MILELLTVLSVSIGNELSHLNNGISNIFATEPSISYIYTPNGSPVAVTLTDNLEDNSRPYYFPGRYATAVAIRDHSSKYNCHSYAWYSQSEHNTCWMTDPSAYWEDSSYLQFFQPMVEDVICYFDYDSTLPCIHSGIVVGFSDYGIPIVESKWEYNELFQHEYYDCPYYDNDYNLRYYRQHMSHVSVDHYCIECGAYTSVHNYHEPYVWRSNSMHRATCVCGATTSLGHVVAQGSGSSGYSTCILCGGRAQIGFIHSLCENEDNYILPNGVIMLSEENYELFLSGCDFGYVNDDYIPLGRRAYN